MNRKPLRPRNMALALAALTWSIPAMGQSPRHSATDALKKKHRLGIPYGDCVSLENKIGQLLFIFVDGNGTNPRAAVHPAYINAVAQMNIGGVRLNSDAGARASVQMYRDAVAAFDHKKMKKPLFIGIDNANMEFLTPQRFSELEIGRRVKALKKKKEIRAIVKLMPAKEAERELRESAIRDLEKKWLKKHKKEEDWGRFFGLGTYKGIIGSMGAKSRECFDRALYLDAFLHKVIGVNTALGPTVDPSNRDKEWLSWWTYLSTASRDEIARRGADALDTFGKFGLATTLKHFPYTPVHFNLHYMNTAVKDNPEEVRNVVKVFSRTNELAKDSAAFVMTTHLYNPNFDSTIATTSKKWLSLLRNDLGYKGIIVTDGIHMVNASGEIEGLLKAQWKQLSGRTIKSTDALFAVLAILAGNDMVIVDSSLSTTKKVFNGILQQACQDSSLAAELRGRIKESYARITAYKDKHGAALGDRPPTPDSGLINDVLDYYERLRGEGAECPSSERFAALKKKIQALGYGVPADKAEAPQLQKARDAR